MDRALSRYRDRPLVIRLLLLIRDLFPARCSRHEAWMRLNGARPKPTKESLNGGSGRTFWRKVRSSATESTT
jgi:hypothetical protein